MKKRLLIGLLLLTAFLNTSAQTDLLQRIRLLYIKNYAQYDQKTRSDGGYVFNPDATKRIINDLNKPYASSQVLSISSFAGSKLRTSGLYNYVTKSYDLTPRTQLYGGELVTNGIFASSTGWVLSYGWSISDGVLSHISPATNTMADYAISSNYSGKLLKILYEIKNYSSGRVTVCLDGGSTVWGTNRSSNGVFEEYLYAPSSLTRFRINASSSLDFVGSVDNISVREVLTPDLTQTTALNQPPLVKIAPSEIPYLSNPNGGSNYLTHPVVSFGSNQAWTVEYVLNRNHNGKDYEMFSGWTGGLKLYFGFNNITKKVSMAGLTGNTINDFATPSSPLVGKNKVLTFVNVPLEGKCKLYVDGSFSSEISSNFDVNFNQLLNGQSSTIWAFSGKIYLYSVWATALPPPEIARRYAVIRSLIPEIETTTIGTQKWAVKNFDAVCTVQGNVIPEVQSNSNTEKVTATADRDFSSDTGFWTKDAGITIADGVSHFSNVAQFLQLKRNGLLTVGNWYKVIYTVANLASGSVCPLLGSNSLPTQTANGTYIGYAQCQTNTTFSFSVRAANSTYDIDNVSVQEVGWSGSQDLYTGIYAQTSGTADQKNYAALKAAAMYCHYNNDPLNGVLYGKLFNWFAVSLLDYDIKAYNTANPTSTYGYHVPTSAEFTTLQTYLGGASVAGGKLKMTGTSFWTTPNTGADNSSGFSALCSGQRHIDGTFSNIGLINYLWSLTTSDTNAYCFRLDYNNNTSSLELRGNTKGNPLRLIKD